MQGRFRRVSRSWSSVAQVLDQPARVLRREALPVVVEVGVDLDVGAPRRDSAPPLLELALGVVAAATPVAAVKADVRPARGELVSLKRTLWVIADHEGDPMATKELVHVGDEPALMPELE